MCACVCESYKPLYVMRKCVYTVYTCLLMKLSPQQTDIKPCPSILPLPITILTFPTPSGPVNPRDPGFEASDPGPDNSFNHLLIPNARAKLIKNPF